MLRKILFRLGAIVLFIGCENYLLLEQKLVKCFISFINMLNIIRLSSTTIDLSNPQRLEGHLEEFNKFDKYASLNIVYRILDGYIESAIVKKLASVFMTTYYYWLMYLFRNHNALCDIAFGKRVLWNSDVHTTPSTFNLAERNSSVSVPISAA